jgi:hypothetical protein
MFPDRDRPATTASISNQFVEVAAGCGAAHVLFNKKAGDTITVNSDTGVRQYRFDRIEKNSPELDLESWWSCPALLFAVLLHFAVDSSRTFRYVDKRCNMNFGDLHEVTGATAQRRNGATAQRGTRSR